VAWNCTAIVSERHGRAPRFVERASLAIASAALVLAAAPAGAASVRISGLSDVAFGTISNFTVDSMQSQSLCLYSKSPPANNYSITATGSGSGGAFLLASGSDTLPYELQWSDTAGQSVGAQLQANQPLTAQHSAASNAVDDCSKGPSATASLIVILRSTALSAASSGTYSGTLTLLVAPE
jgi:spore coat protein U-like protein